MPVIPPTSSVGVLPGRLKPASLIACMLRDEAFMRATREAASLLGAEMASEGFDLGTWAALPSSPRVADRAGWRAPLLDGGLGQVLELRLVSRIAEDGRVEVQAQVVDPSQEPPALVVGVCMGATAPLRDWAATPDALQRLAREIEGQMSFIELAAGTGGGTLRAIRMAKFFYEPASWVPDAAKVLLAALSPS